MTRHVVFGTGQSAATSWNGSSRPARRGPRRQPLRPGTIAGATVVGGDATDRAFTTTVTAGADVVYFCLNAVDYARWAEEFPPLQRGVLAGAQAGARLVVLDNLYAYGPTRWPRPRRDPPAHPDLREVGHQGGDDRRADGRAPSRSRRGQHRPRVGLLRTRRHPVGSRGDRVRQRPRRTGRPGDGRPRPAAQLLVHARRRRRPDHPGHQPRRCRRIWHLPIAETRTTRQIVDRSTGSPAKTHASSPPAPPPCVCSACSDRPCVSTCTPSTSSPTAGSSTTASSEPPSATRHPARRRPGRHPRAGPATASHPSQRLPRRRAPHERPDHEHDRARRAAASMPEPPCSPSPASPGSAPLQLPGHPQGTDVRHPGRSTATSRPPSRPGSSSSRSAPPFSPRLAPTSAGSRAAVRPLDRRPRYRSSHRPSHRPLTLGPLRASAQRGRPDPAPRLNALSTPSSAHTWLGQALGETPGYALTATFTVLVLVALTRNGAPRWLLALGYALRRPGRHRRPHPARHPGRRAHQLRRLHRLESLAACLRRSALEAARQPGPTRHHAEEPGVGASRVARGAGTPVFHASTGGQALRELAAHRPHYDREPVRRADIRRSDALWAIAAEARRRVVDGGPS